MKCLIVYHSDGRWYGSEINWKRSGSGTYREISGLDLPQSRPEIERFAEANQYSIEWRGPIPAEAPATTA